MVFHTDQPANQPVLHRPRLHALIGEGLQHPLLVMLAAPGYGKTQAMADYLERSGQDALWLRFGILDNLTSHFWEHLINALAKKHRDIAARLQELEFPDTLLRFHNFARVMEENICAQENVIWVFDDYGVIDNQQVLHFVRMLVEANFENFHLALLSNVLDRIESVAFMTTKRALILADDLRFSKSEIQELYLLHRVSLQQEALDALERFTEGWALPLHLLIGVDTLPDIMRQGEKITHHTISDLFEERFFSNYSRQQQKLLIKLSLLDFFTKEFAAALQDGGPDETDILADCAFLFHEPNKERLYLHHLYRLFLQEKAHLLPPEEKRQLWQKAAEYYAASGDYFAAVDCFCKCKDYKSMLETIDRHTNLVEFTETTARYYLGYIDLLTPEELKQYPLADYVRVRIYLGIIEFDKAEALLLDLEARLRSGRLEASPELCIDIYMMLGNIHMMRSQEDFADYFKKAAAYLPQRKDAQRTNRLYLLNIHDFSIADNKPGAVQRMERALYEGVPWFSKVCNGGTSGSEYLFSAEAAYLCNKMEETKQHAYRAIYKAEGAMQHDIVCNAYIMLARAGFASGDFDEMTRHINALAEYAGKFGSAPIHNIGVLKEIRDTALAWYYIKLRDYAKIPKSIFDYIQSEQPLLAHGRPQMVYANYLINIREYAQLTGLLEHPRGYLASEGKIKMDTISRFIMLAIGYDHIGNSGAAMKSLWTAYDMCYNNGLVMLFIEANTHMQSLITAARTQSKYTFSPDWLQLIEQEIAGFNKRTSAVRKVYERKKPPAAAKGSPLSKREHEVLQALAKGMTREEIALEQYISINTVKSTLTNIYNKLGANNKGDAISIAITRGYIGGYTQEF